MYTKRCCFLDSFCLSSVFFFFFYICQFQATPDASGSTDVNWLTSQQETWVAFKLTGWVECDIASQAVQVSVIGMRQRRAFGSWRDKQTQVYPGLHPELTFFMFCGAEIGVIESGKGSSCTHIPAHSGLGPLQLPVASQVTTDEPLNRKPGLHSKWQVELNVLLLPEQFRYPLSGWDRGHSIAGGTRKIQVQLCNLVFGSDLLLKIRTRKCWCKSFSRYVGCDLQQDLRKQMQRALETMLKFCQTIAGIFWRVAVLVWYPEDIMWKEIRESPCIRTLACKGTCCLLLFGRVTPDLADHIGFQVFSHNNNNKGAKVLYFLRNRRDSTI